MIKFFKPAAVIPMAKGKIKPFGGVGESWNRPFFGFFIYLFLTRERI